MKPLEHDIVRPWLCCKDCKNEYETKRRRANGRPQSIDRLKDGSLRAERHDDKVDTILELLYS
jgi:hypothetical protein